MGVLLQMICSLWTHCAISPVVEGMHTTNPVKSIPNIVNVEFPSGTAANTPQEIWPLSNIPGEMLDPQLQATRRTSNIDTIAAVDQNHKQLFNQVSFIADELLRSPVRDEGPEQDIRIPERCLGEFRMENSTRPAKRLKSGRDPQHCASTGPAVRAMYDGFAECLNEPGKIQYRVGPGQARSGFLGNVPVPRRGSQALQQSTPENQSSKSIVEVRAQEGMQGNLSNDHRPPDSSPLESQNPVEILKESHFKKRPIPLFSFPTLESCSSKQALSHPSNDFKQLPPTIQPNPTAVGHPSLLAFGYYSHQALAWFPGQVSQIASLGAHALAYQLLQHIADLDTKAKLQKMHESNGILIPFIYNLILKELSNTHWVRIKEVWGYLWQHWSQLKNVDSDEEVLRTEKRLFPTTIFRLQ
ncbi:hypothetical protein PGT21_019095 [Puccinia graminis f. sp. tritici]|uniref:Uncharacterized protein n=1 Tax=Puccinia graminis f. sp. tritici TaxID=56615 RepID=A0A5B0QTK5_PUCGR|nr:hypothetical protein PGT21_019095 [Puccinia graminis f. sp. tritici]